MNARENRPEIESERPWRAPITARNTQPVVQPSSEERHYAPIRGALPAEAPNYEWRHETGAVQSYQHRHEGSWVHLDPRGQFYNRHAEPISREVALTQNRQSHEIARAPSAPSTAQKSTGEEHGIIL